MGKIYAGTSGWAYATWKPDFYPEKLASAKFLGHYSSRLNTVEVNYTFRHFPTEKLLRGWMAATPPEFKFVFKANQKITHIKRLKDVAEFTSEFVVALQPLDVEKKLGPVLFQFVELCPAGCHRKDSGANRAAASDVQRCVADHQHFVAG